MLGQESMDGFRIESMKGVRPVSELKVLADRTAPVSPASDPDVPAQQVSGLVCKKGHFNDPDVAYCVICGISMLQSPRKLVRRPRPQMGVLIFDNGMTVPVRNDLVLGRTPESDGTVSAGTANGVRLVDPLVGGVHAKVLLREWKVSLLDAGADGGTYVCRPGEKEWTQLEPGAEVELLPGSSAAFGRCVVTYHSHRDHTSERRSVVEAA
jgi:hypothetical protein